MLELLIALAIMSAAFAIIWSTFSATVRAWTRGSELLDNLHHGDFVMEQMVSALRSAAFFSTAPDKYGFHLKDRGTGRDAADVVSWVTSGTAFLPPDSPLANGLHRITVTIEDNRDGKPSVCVMAYPHLADIDEGSVETEKWFISSEVKGLECQVYNKEDEDWDDEWEDTNSIPRLVQITLYMDPLEKYGDPVKLERLVELPVAPPLDAAVTPEGSQGAKEGEGNPPPERREENPPAKNP
ncbi:MAG: hypothetical protein A2X46_14150 [Lentisphaerae bacterium GWF2_57_35]|nr:MAG: hypothetical protein A2X46_14150 [Lentisphaerae bacterium GWF2_57_35]